jgi:uncharacterized protein (DUF779 family)
MGSAAVPARVALTAEAAELVRRLTARHGPVMFHQSGGCCDGSAPMCYPVGELQTGAADVLLGRLQVEGLGAPVEVWMSRAQFGYWSHTHLTIDVVPGRGAGFSLEAPDGVRFLLRSRLLTQDELDELADADGADDADGSDDSDDSDDADDADDADEKAGPAARARGARARGAPAPGAPAPA